MTSLAKLPEKFRKKPVVIEAMQFAIDASAYALLNWANQKQAEHGREFVRWENSALKIPTLEGVMEASPGDWIICGVQGELYPCKPDIFAATYEPALSPAELGGVEAVAWMRRDVTHRKFDGFTGEPTGRRVDERIITDRRVYETDIPLYTTPRAAEAPTVSLADIGMCKWAAHILSDPERFNARANDASAAIGRLVAALTPPSAKGENSDG